MVCRKRLREKHAFGLVDSDGNRFRIRFLLSVFGAGPLGVKRRSAGTQVVEASTGLFRMGPHNPQARICFQGYRKRTALAVVAMTIRDY